METHVCIFLMQTKNGVKKACQRFPTIFSAIKNCLWLIRSILVRKRDQRFLIYLVRLRMQQIVRLRNENSAK